MNSILALTALTPIISGILSEAIGYRFIFTLTTGGLVVSSLLALGLAEPRELPVRGWRRTPKDLPRRKKLL